MNKYCIIISLLFSIINAELIKPNNGQRLNYIHVMFEWEQIPDVVGYNIQVSKQSNFSPLILNKDEISTVYIDENNFSWNESYYWRVRGVYSSENNNPFIYGEWIETSSFSIGPILYSPVSVNVYEDNMVEHGYIAIGGFQPALESVIIDIDGNEIWNDGGFAFLLNHINEYGNIYGFSTIDYPLNSGMKSNMDMDVVWSTMDSNPDNAVDTHEIKQLPNGNYMAFVRQDGYGPIPDDNYMTQYFRALGYEADGVTPEFLWYGQKIVEWDQNHEVVWSWNPFDHFTMQDYDNYEGTWYNAYFNQEVDWMHSNAFHFDHQESVIYVSHRHLSRISKIAYPSGEVIWNMGLPITYMHSGNEHICNDLLFSFQHNIQLMDNGDLIFFDNGNLSDMLLGDDSPTSRVRRVKVIDNSHCETIWEYDLPPGLHGSGMGSVQVLDNGNYSIYTFGNGLAIPECSIIEVTPEKEIVWKATGVTNSAWYRSYKIPSLHPDAFSVLAYNFKEIDGANKISTVNGQIKFTVYNKSGYSMSYQYTLEDLSNPSEPHNSLFLDEEGVLNLDPYENVELVFSVVSNSESSDIALSIFPYRHEYATKNLFFNVDNNSLLLGDINFDNEVNILDVVILVDYALNSGYSNVGDMNQDLAINVLDVVVLVGLILN